MRNKTRMSLIALGALVLSACTAPHVPDQDVVIVSIIALIANPDAYEGKVVQTAGIATIDGFEGDAIWLSREDISDGAHLNSIALSLHDAPVPEEARVRLNGHHVVVRGVFKRLRDGRHSISGVSRIYARADAMEP